jgi:hydrogenase nickel incorporation protein HypA/HybF
MHELSIAENLVEIVREEMAKAGLTKLNAVHLKIGEFTHLVPDALSFCFEIATQGGPLEGATLEIEVVPTTGFCQRCQEEFHVEGVLFICPRCRGGDVEVRTGREMTIEAIDAD